MLLVGGAARLASSDDHEALPPNVSSNLHFKRGDIEAELAAADVVVENTYRLPMVHQGYMEPQVVAVSVDPMDNLTVYTSTQAIFYTRNEIAAALGMSQDKVKVVAMTIGGGFGGKFMLVEALAAAVARRRLRDINGRTKSMCRWANTVGLRQEGVRSAAELAGRG